MNFDIDLGDDISRENAIYRDIEFFQVYELTYAITYEMAIRNKKVISTLEEMQHICLESKEEFSKVKDTHNSTFTMWGVLEDVDTDIILNLKKQYWKLSEYLKNEFYFDLDETDLLSNRESILNNRELSDGPKPTVDEVIHDLIRNIKNPRDRIFHPIYNAKIPTVPKDKSKKVQIDIDLALPEEEMIAQVKAMKKIYTSLYNSFSLTLNDISQENGIYDKRVRQYNEVDNIYYPDKIKSQLYSDMFFTYDVLTYREDSYENNIEYIQTELRYFYKNIIVNANDLDKYGSTKKDKISNLIYDKLTPLNKDTIEAWFESLNKLIENTEYKNLLI